ncbi:quinone oxidoreductase [Gallibacterium salpingitidis]|uniref:MDR family oxidoreductase n=1 Tax=Gallibacterium salpingitidis TaxID=505341 RepID=UPI0008048A5C|nr:MDR family oxidoreductase [Gallibacterium salpingitidis]OBX06447.1 quinone oxidoreductase [Gallibacterium salpingitidis]
MKALVLRQTETEPFKCQLENIDERFFPEAQRRESIKIKVHYSSLNYKDALAICGVGKIIKQYPFIPGIDVVGSVASSSDANFKVGDLVLATGFGYGEVQFGAMSEFAFVQPQHLLKLSGALTEYKAIALGTAGLTAMLSVEALRQAGITPEKGPVIVTGASGGVGSISVYLLIKLGYQVSAVSGNSVCYQSLLQLGVQKVYDRHHFSEPCRPLEKQQFAGVIDTVGGDILANLLTKVQYGGCVACCGLAQSYQLNTTVMPFILRNVRLQGIDSVYFPLIQRQALWQELARLIEDDYLKKFTREIALADVPSYAKKLLEHQLYGRTIVKIG